MALADVISNIRTPTDFDADGVSAEIANLDESELESLANGAPQAADAFRISRLRVKAVEDHLNECFVSKAEIVRMLLACTIAQVPIILLGPPGTAKSDVVRTLCKALDLRFKHEKIKDYEEKLRLKLSEARALQASNGKHSAPGDAVSSRDKLEEMSRTLRVGERPMFEYLMTRYTTPEEILGPANIDALLTFSLYYRESAGMLPHTQVAFLDEIFKANSAILNSLLSIINERIYYNAGRAFDVDLLMVYGASNEAPDTEELAALYDRFPIRAVSDHVPDEKVDELTKRSIELAYNRNVAPLNRNGRAGKYPDAPSKLAALNDFRMLSRINYVHYFGRKLGENGPTRGGFNFAKEFPIVLRQLREEFGISDRTPERLMRVAKAMAVLDDAPHMQPRHLGVFKYVAPTVDGARIVGHVVDDIVRQYEKQYGRDEG